MNTLEVRFEDVSGRESLLVTANLADGWKRLPNSFGFYGLAHQEYQKDNRVTVRVWVVERSAELHPAGNGFPLDLQSMGSSPSKAVAFRLFHGRLSLGTSMSTVVNSSRNGGKPGFYEDAILIARHGGAAYWLRFYAALNEEHPEPPEWLEHALWAEEGVLPEPEQIPGAPAPEIEERLTRLSLALDALQGRVGALGEDFQGRVATSLRALEEKSAGQAEDLEKVARELGERWSRQFQQQAEAALERLRDELKNSVIEEGRRQLVGVAEGSQQFQKQAEAAIERLREELNALGQVTEEGKRQLAGVADAKLASLSEAARDESGQDIAQVIREQAQAAHAAADSGVETIRQAAAEAVAQLQGKLQEQAEAAVARVREEAQNSGLLIEEGKRQLAGLAEEKLAFLSQATRDASGQQMEQAIQEQAQAAQAAADSGVKSIRRAAEEAVTQLQGKLQEQAEAAVARVREEAQNSGLLIEEGKRQLASLAEAKLATLSQATRDTSGQQMEQATQEQAQAAQAADAEVKSIQQATEAAMAHLQAEFEKQTAAAVEKLREEAKNSGRVIEEGKRQVSNLAEIKLGSLGQATARAAAGFEAEQRRLKNQYETARKELETLLARRLATLKLTPYGTRRHGTVAKLALAVGLFLAITVPPFCVYISTPPPAQLRLQAERPPDYVDQNPNWNSKRRDREEEVAQAYWRVAVENLQGKYPFDSELPADPPSEFQVDSMYDPPGGAKALAETRNYDWERLRSCWLQREYWVEAPARNLTWIDRLRQLWQQIKAKLT